MGTRRVDIPDITVKKKDKYETTQWGDIPWGVSIIGLICVICILCVIVYGGLAAADISVTSLGTFWISHLIRNLPGWFAYSCLFFISSTIIAAGWRWMKNTYS